jgi:WD40 repeat protein
MKTIICIAFLAMPFLAQAQSVLETKIQTGHSNRISSYDFSSDNKLLFTGGYDRKILMTDIQSGREIRSFIGHELAISSIDLSADDKFIVSGGYDQMVMLWDVNTGKQLKVFKGHNEGVTTVGFSPDGKYIISGGEKLILWDFVTGKAVKEFSETDNYYFGFSGINKATFSSDSKYIIAKYTPGYVIAWDVATGALVMKTEVPSSTMARVTKIDLPGKDAESEVINFHVGTFERTPMWGGSTTNSAKKSADIFLKRDSPAMKNTTYNFSDQLEGYDNGDESICFVAGTSYFITGRTVPEVYDYVKGVKYQFDIQDEGHKSSILRITVSEGLQYIVTASKDESILWQVDQEKGAIKMLSKLDEKGLMFGLLPGTSSFVRTSAYGFIDIVTFNQGFYATFALRKNAYPVKAMDVSPDGNSFCLGVQSDNTIHVWDMVHGRERNIFTPDLREYDEVSCATFTPNGKFLVATADYSPQYIGWLDDVGKGKLVIYDLEKKSMVLESDIAKGAPVLTISPDSRYVAIGTRGPQLSDDGATIIVIDIVERKAVANFTGYLNISGLSFSPDGKLLAFSDYSDATINVKQVQSRVGILDIFAKTEVAGPYLAPDSLGIYSISFSPDGKQIAAGGYKSAFIFDSMTGKLQKTLKGHTSKINSIHYSSDGKQIITGSNDNTAKVFDLLAGKVIANLKGHNSTVTNAVFHPNKPLLLTSSLDGSVKLWNRATGEQMVSFVSMLSTKKTEEGGTLYFDGMVAYTPDNYYYCNKPAYDGIHFVKNNKYFNFLNFDLQYNRPDIILKRIGMSAPKEIDMYKKAHDKRVAKMGFTDQSFLADANIPEVHITPPTEPVTMTPTLSLPIEAVDTKYPLKSIQVYVNGVPYWSRKGFDIASKNLMKFQQTIDLPLSIGKNQVEVSALNMKGAESIIETFNIEYTPQTTDKHDLYIFAIGAGKYTDASKNLNYPAKDAKDIVTLFTKDPTKYRNIISEVISDNQATRAKILAVKEKLKLSKPDDEVIIFYAGHGILDANLNYYLGTYNIGFAKPDAMGLAYDDLENVLDGIPARKKLLLVDACHSGEIDKDEVVLAQAAAKESGSDIQFRAVGDNTVVNLGLENSFELMKELFADLRRGSGTSVISAAGGGEFALESSEWNNGVFTYVIQSGLLQGKADANGDGKIYISELLNYSQAEVSRLTNGKQKPTSRAENISNDWVVY